MTSNATCPSPATATSSAIVMTVNPIVAPSITISPSANPICAGNSVTFTASPTNGGGAPSYQWKLGATNVGTNSPTYTLASPANGNSITCVLTSNASCLSTTTATSAATVMTVNPIVTPSVSASASSTTICAGSSVTFTATPTNGGSTPFYQWYRNGINVGTNSTTYSNSVLTNGDVISVTMISNATCPSTTTVSSSNINMTVNPILTPSVNIAASATTICAGSSVTFTATPTNGGGSPAYQWKKNGVNTGTNSSTFITTTLANSDVISCVLTSNATCVSPTTATSNSLSMTVNPYLTPAVSVSATATTICAGTNVTFTATPTNGGSSPSYQWKKNGVNIGTNSSTFASASLANNDVITVVMTSNYSCLNTPTATSSGITMTVNPILTPTVTISASPSASVCIGSTVTFSASITNGGNSPSYQWRLNGNNVGSGTTYSSSALSNGDVVTCRLTSNYSCTSTNPVTSSGITMTIFDLPVISTTPVWPLACQGGSGATVTATGASTYTWSPATGLSSTTGSTITANPSSGRSYTVTGTDSHGCVSTDVVYVGVSSGNASTSITAGGPTTFCNGGSVSLTASSNIASGDVTFGSNTNSSQGADFGSALGPNPLQNFFAGSKTQMLYRSSELTAQNIVAGTIISSLSINMRNGDPTYTLMDLTVAIKPTSTATLSAFETGLFIVRSPADYVANDGWCTITFDTPFVYDGTSNLVFDISHSNGGLGTFGNNNRSYYSSTSFTSTLFYRDSYLSAADFTNYTGSEDFSYSSRPQIRFATSTTYSYAWTPVTAVTPSNGLGAAITVAPTTPTTYTVTATSSAGCAATASQAINVNPIVTPSVTLSANTGTTICAGTAVTFTATPSNGGASPTYSWRKNGSPVGNNSGTYSNTLLANNDVISVTLTSNASCLATTTANTSVTMTVNPFLAPSVSIAASANPACTGSSVTFTATPTNGGTSPTFVWRKNGSPTGDTGSTFTSSSLNNGDIISVVMTTNYACPTTPTATSNSITMTINPYVTPSVAIGISPTIICPGTTVTLTATPTNGGATPTYVWKKNGSTVGGSSATYVDATFVDGDIIEVTLTTSVLCYTSATGVATTTITVTPNVTPTVTITPSTGSSICAGDFVTFSANITNGGSAPTYLWRRNGSSVSTSATYASGSISNGNDISVLITSNAACAVPTTATHNVVMTVTQPVVPGVAISATSTTVCAGQSMTFTATPLNGGTTPSYAWMKNGNPVGSDQDTYTDNTLVNGDQITVTMISSAICAQPISASSSAITMTVDPNLTPSISLSANPICEGDQLVVSSNISNGGSSPTYSWFSNGNPVGGNSNSLSIGSVTDGDVISCELTSSRVCVTSNTASNSIAIQVNLNPAVSILGANNICAVGTNSTSALSLQIDQLESGASLSTYQWLLNGSDANGSNATFTATQVGNYSVIVEDSNGCSGISPAFNVGLTTYEITLVSGPHGTSSLSGSSTVSCGGTRFVTFTADPCYHIADILLDGVSQGNTNTVTLTDINANHTIEASFDPIMYHVNADYTSLGTGGTISPGGEMDLQCGTSNTFSIIPDPCYHITDVIVNGFSQGPISSFTINDLNSNYDIFAVFSVDIYNVSVVQPTGGNITPAGTTQFNCGTSQTFNIDAQPGYVVNGINVDGNPVGALTSYTMNSISSNHTIEAFLSTSPINNNRHNAPAMVVFTLPSCYNTQGTLAGCTPSPESSYHPAPSGSGQDAWYRFSVPAGSTGIARITVSNTNNDVAIILQKDIATAPYYQPIAIEDALHAPGAEMMTAQGLIPGSTYRVAVQNMGLQTAGSFSMCVTFVKAVTCVGGSNNAKNLCESFVGGYTGANQYVFTLTNTTAPTEVFHKTMTGASGGPSQTAFVLNTLPGLRYGASYNVKIDATYAFSNGAGQVNNVVVPGSDPTCVLYIVQQPETELEEEHQCENGPVRFTTFIHTGFVCGASDYQWEITPMTGLPFPWTTRRYSSSRYIKVGDLNGIYSGSSHFHVRVRPIMPDGQGGERFGAWGESEEICLLGAANAPTTEDQTGTTYPSFQQRSLSQDVNEVDIELYPNPSNGEAISLNMEGINDDTIQMKVTDATGRTIWSNQFTVDGSLRTNLDLGNNISNGLYLLEINYDGKVATRRIMIQR